jgi:hypothetical protein
VRDKDIIFVANAELTAIYKSFQGLTNLTGAILTGLSGLTVCTTAKC